MALEPYRTLLEVSRAIAEHRDVKALFHDLSGLLRRVVRFDFLNLVLHESETGTMHLHILESEQITVLPPYPAYPVDLSPAGWAWRDQMPIVVDDTETATEWPSILDVLRANRVVSCCYLPLTTAQTRLGALGLGYTAHHDFTADEIEFMKTVTAQVAVAVENAINFRQLSELKDRLAKEKLYLENEIRTAWNSQEMVGESPVFRHILGQVETVAATEATVLILGETGTGKELVARAIHQLSPRSERTLVKLNCAAIPTGLLESELFGHEKGAFTGAIQQKIGRLELADKGTLFLDEVGDIPLELQPKLLRALQEHEFERLGSTRTLRVNFRLIAATNRDLQQMVGFKQFRADLYYRLNVFPIVLPPLRERQDDIPLLISYFVQKFARLMNRRIEKIPSETMLRLTRYAWPGNVRELENLVERAVILSSGPVLRVPELDELAAAPTTLEAAEREHITRVLNETGWVLSGPKGAAERLGMKRTTLQSRMKKLGIQRAGISADDADISAH